MILNFLCLLAPRDKEIENQPGGVGLGEKQTQVLHVCNTIYGRSLVQLYSLWLTDHKRFNVRWVRREIIYRIQVQEFSIRRLNLFLSELIIVGCYDKKFVTSLQVCRLKLPLFCCCFLVRLGKSKFCLSTYLPKRDTLREDNR